MELELLQGTWRAVRIVTGGRVVPGEVARAVRYSFEGDRVRLAEGDQPAGEGRRIAVAQVGFACTSYTYIVAKITWPRCASCTPQPDSAGVHHESL